MGLRSIFWTDTNAKEKAALKKAQICGRQSMGLPDATPQVRQTEKNLFHLFSPPSY